MHLLHETREASLHTSGRSVTSLKQHRAIVRAIEARDPVAAERRMREHIAGMEKLVFATQGFTDESGDDGVKAFSASRAEISS
jgi:DNA-binding FadR family transcriptional regulator